MEIYKNHYCVRRCLQWVCVNIWPIFHLKLQRLHFRYFRSFKRISKMFILTKIIFYSICFSILSKLLFSLFFAIFKFIAILCCLHPSLLVIVKNIYTNGTLKMKWTLSMILSSHKCTNKASPKNSFMDNKLLNLARVICSNWCEPVKKHDYIIWRTARLYSLTNVIQFVRKWYAASLSI